MNDVSQWKQGHREILFFTDRNFLDALDSVQRKKHKLPPSFVAQTPLSLFLRCSWVLYVHHSNAGGAALWSHDFVEGSNKFEPFVFHIRFRTIMTDNGQAGEWFPLCTDGSLLGVNPQNNALLTESGKTLSWDQLSNARILRLGWRGAAFPLRCFCYLPPLLWKWNESYDRSKKLQRDQRGPCWGSQNNGLIQEWWCKPNDQRKL
jgi:hypothetical protein